MAGEGHTGIVDHTLVHRAVTSASAAPANYLRGGQAQRLQHVGRIARVELARRHGGSQCHRQNLQFAGLVRRGRGAGIEDADAQRQAELARPRQQQIGIADCGERRLQRLPAQALPRGPGRYLPVSPGVSSKRGMVATRRRSPQSAIPICCWRGRASSACRCASASSIPAPRPRRTSPANCRFCRWHWERRDGGQARPAQCAYVLQTLRLATTQVLAGAADALVTAPVHKGVINDAGVPFTAIPNSWRNCAAHRPR